MAYNQEIAEAEKICDRQIRSIICTNKNRICRIKFAKNIIRDLENYGPAGTLHMAVLSSIIRKNIKIWNSDGNLNRIIGKEKKGDTVEVEYHPTNLGHIGHWTLRSGKDPDNIDINLNSCLFSVIGSQTGQNPSDLRRWTVLKLKSDLQKFANQVDKIIRSKRNDEVALIGGARYIGTSPNDAKQILDNSQGRKAHEMEALGHPRGHASYPSAIGNMDSVERYSLSSGKSKSGFLSREDQDKCAHWILKSPIAQRAMCDLNKKAIKVQIHLPADQLLEAQQLPKAKRYFQGQGGREQDIKILTIILHHHLNQSDNPEADVFVHTFFPRLEMENLAILILEYKIE